ncbi:hypothetical protein WJX73_001167 [Symbiochloris irregularis]|uniref:50S ribosomal protein L21, chloroplastic n=1 Tax=Symbiochloris irregularis TaxID=706552 RepID=A0AAW1NN43_9CHLO
MLTQINSPGHTCSRLPGGVPHRLASPVLVGRSQLLSAKPLQKRDVRRQAGEGIRIPEAPASPPPYAVSTDKYAIVELGGHQLFVEEGRWYTVNKLVAEPGSKIQLRRVMGVKSGGNFTVGRPFLDNVTVEADVVEDLKGPKVMIFKYRPKKHYRKKTGHRQPLTKFLVTKIQTA